MHNIGGPKCKNMLSVSACGVRKRKAETWCVSVCSSYKRKAYGLQHHSCLSVGTFSLKFRREKHFAANSLQQRSCRCSHRAILHLQFETRGFCKIPCCNLLHDGSESKPTCETKSVPNDANDVLLNHFVTLCQLQCWTVVINEQAHCTWYNIHRAMYMVQHMVNVQFICSVYVHLYTCVVN